MKPSITSLSQFHCMDPISREYKLSIKQIIMLMQRPGLDKTLHSYQQTWRYISEITATTVNSDNMIHRE